MSRPAGVNRHQTGLTEEGEGSIIDREEEERPIDVRVADGGPEIGEASLGEAGGRTGGLPATQSGERYGDWRDCCTGD